MAYERYADKMMGSKSEKTNQAGQGAALFGLSVLKMFCPFLLAFG